MEKFSVTYGNRVVEEIQAVKYKLDGDWFVFYDALGTEAIPKKSIRAANVNSIERQN